MHIVKIKKIHIRKRTLVQWMALYLFLMPFFLNAIQSVSGSLSVLKYTLDIIWVGIGLLTLSQSKLVIQKRLVPFLVITLGFALYTVIVYAFRFQSAFYFLWGFRNNFRYYVAFFIFASLLDEADLEFGFKTMEVLFWVNVAVTFVQYFFLGYSWDYLGGIFGTAVGSNASTLLFFCIILARSVLLMMSGKKRTVPCVAELIMASVVAALAEIKVFFVIVVVILATAAVLTKFSWKKCFLLSAMAMCVYLGSAIMVAVFGESSALSIENVLSLIFAKSYATSNDLSRWNAIKVLSRTIMKEPLAQWFGLGLGNCDTSSFAICNTPFFQNYSWMHYTWFSSAFLFLETGYIGLTLYVSFFGVCIVSFLGMLRRENKDQLICRVAIIVALVCVILVVYNSSLRTDIGYIAYFMLAAPFVANRRRSLPMDYQEGTR